MKATEVNAGLADSNGSLLPGLWRDSLHVTCGLTACTPGSAPGPTLVNEYRKTLPLLLPLPGEKTEQRRITFESKFLKVDLVNKDYQNNTLQHASKCVQPSTASITTQSRLV